MTLKDNIWVIGAIIYVLGMFPLFYSYQYLHIVDYGAVDLIATAGAFIVMVQAFFAISNDKPQSASAKGQTKTSSP